MKRMKLLAIALLLPFTALTGYALYDVGFIGVFEHQFANAGGAQVWVDLAIALLLIMAWMIPHAKRTGRNPWPYVVTTAIAGCYGPLLYLALAPAEDPL